MFRPRPAPGVLEEARHVGVEAGRRSCSTPVHAHEVTLGRPCIERSSLSHIGRIRFRFTMTYVYRPSSGSSQRRALPTLKASTPPGIMTGRTPHPPSIDCYIPRSLVLSTWSHGVEGDLVLGEAASSSIAPRLSGGDSVRERPRFKLEPWPGEPVADSQFAVILHITDLHLNRTHQTPSSRRSLVEALINLLAEPVAVVASWMAEELLLSRSVGDDSAWHELVQLLERLTVADGDNAVVVAQTGDVEAFGAATDGSHPGYTLLHDQVWKRLEDLGARCVDVFGNHDIWPSLLFGRHFDEEHAAGPVRLATEHPRLLGPWDVIHIETPGEAPGICIHRICTVEPKLIPGGFLAQGRIVIEPHPEGTDPPPKIHERIPTRLQQRDVVHLALSHHPIHRVPGVAPIIGLVRDLDHILESLDGQVLVLSGHLHLLHPAVGSTVAVPQVVATSPTVPSKGAHAPSLVQYVLVDRPDRQPEFVQLTDRIYIQRMVYTYSSGQGYAEPPVRQFSILD